VVLGCIRLGFRSQRLLAPLTIAGAILAVTAALYFNGERTGGPALLNEFFYVWPALYAGYFYGRSLIAVVVAAIAVSYVSVNVLMEIAVETFLVRALITVSVVAGTALVAHSLRTYVDALITRLDLLARTDALTGLLNRRCFDERLAEELERAERSPQPLSVLVGDIDHFKALNDVFGHASGDRVLAAVAGGLRSSVRNVDTLARIGGEEFAVVMPNTRADEGVEAAERLRLSLARVSDPAGQPVRITFGVASTENADGIDSDALLLAADRALYSGKARGRDQSLAYVDSMRGAIVAH
jgi:diguanylate cyclase (GGDEF)-like protein